MTSGVSLYIFRFLESTCVLGVDPTLALVTTTYPCDHVISEGIQLTSGCW